MISFEACGFDFKVGKGRAVVLSAAYTCGIELFRKFLESWGRKPLPATTALTMVSSLTPTVSREGERFQHLLDLDSFDKELRMALANKPLFGGKTLKLHGKTGLLMPLDVGLGKLKSYAPLPKIQNRDDKQLEFRLSQPQEVIMLEPECEIEPGYNCEIKREGKRVVITSRKMRWWIITSL